mmetsp:Transcript_23201/g.58612  ORF Transcript_23201/g.58612 Transcript_23201/m.58612 type:complete len:396 (-) Transcript_23201:767-1954(-)|eukprot:g11427.t1
MAAINKFRVLQPGVGERRSYGSDYVIPCARRILENVNRIRIEKGLNPLSTHKGLCKAAEVHAAKMSEALAPFSHQNALSRINDAGSFEGCGENLARLENYVLDSVPDAAVEGWVHSPGHFRNMVLPDFNVCGIGVATYFREPPVAAQQAIRSQEEARARALAQKAARTGRRNRNRRRRGDSTRGIGGAGDDEDEDPDAPVPGVAADELEDAAFADHFDTDDGSEDDDEDHPAKTSSSAARELPYYAMMGNCPQMEEPRESVTFVTMLFGIERKQQTNAKTKVMERTDATIFTCGVVGAALGIGGIMTGGMLGVAAGSFLHKAVGITPKGTAFCIKEFTKRNLLGIGRLKCSFCENDNAKFELDDMLFCADCFGSHDSRDDGAGSDDGKNAAFVVL